MPSKSSLFKKSFKKKGNTDALLLPSSESVLPKPLKNS